MITYDYRCSDCGWHYEPRPPPDHELPVCFRCATTMVQQLHPPGIVFLGDGWTKKGDER